MKVATKEQKRKAGEWTLRNAIFSIIFVICFILAFAPVSAALNTAGGAGALAVLLGGFTRN